MPQIMGKSAMRMILFILLSFALIPSVASATGFVMGNAPEGLDEVTDLSEIVVNITNWVLGFVTIIAVLALIWGGIQYLTAAGDESKVETGKHIITYAVLGLIIIGISFAIVAVVVNVWIGSDFS